MKTTRRGFLGSLIAVPAALKGMLTAKRNPMVPLERHVEMGFGGLGLSEQASTVTMCVTGVHLEDGRIQRDVPRRWEVITPHEAARMGRRQD